jgi:hypothetical protein
MAGNTGLRLLVAFSSILVGSVLRGQQAQTNRPDPFPPTWEVRSASELAPLHSAPGFPTFHGRPVLHLVPRMIHTSGIIFSGQVTSVSRARAVPGEQASPTVITFHVQHAIRGAVAGQKLTIREWPGLWNRGERYRVGEHVFLFLYPPSRLGLTSPVAGTLGRLAMDSQERILIRPETAGAFAPDFLFGGKDAVAYTDFEQALLHIRYEK